MGKIIKSIKAKEPIRLRSKELANGNKSLYLDCYVNGKRYKEYLKLYIIPEHTPLDKTSNKETIRIAETIKAKRIIELSNIRAGLKAPKDKLPFLGFMKMFCQEQERQGKKWTKQCYNATDRLSEYADERTTLGDITPDFCRGFINYLCHIYRTAQGKPLTNYTTKNYLSVLNSALNYAVRHNYILNNPLGSLSSNEIPQKPESQRVFLTIEELKRLELSECKNECVKNAYLFSCYCGLRISDVKRLKWGDIEKTTSGLILSIIQKKTQKPLYLPLNEKATNLLPKNNDFKDDELVFSKLPNVSNVDKILKKWAVSVGINKKITFHTARHTFATLLLTKGATMEVTSKLMGHSEIRTTQIYAKIVDEVRVNAVNLLNNL